jgi:hypothetical protein
MRNITHDFPAASAMPYVMRSRYTDNALPVLP